MEKMVYSLDDKVDYYLHKIAVAPTLKLDARTLYEVSVLNEDSYLIDQVMLEKGLIKIEREARVITGKGLEISNFGGWSYYQKRLRKEDEREIFESDKSAKRFEWENSRLKKRVLSLEHELNESKQKENAAQSTIHNLIRQNRNSKVTWIIAGVVIGVLMSVSVWMALLR